MTIRPLSRVDWRMSTLAPRAIRSSCSRDATCSLRFRFRRAFVAPPDWELLSADYSQVELRILAHVAGESSLIDSFLAGQDIRAATAARLFEVPIDEYGTMQQGEDTLGAGLFGVPVRWDEITPQSAPDSNTPS